MPDCLRQRAAATANDAAGSHDSSRGAGHASNHGGRRRAERGMHSTVARYAGRKAAILHDDLRHRRPTFPGASSLPRCPAPGDSRAAWTTACGRLHRRSWADHSAATSRIVCSRWRDGPSVARTLGRGSKTARRGPDSTTTVSVSQRATRSSEFKKSLHHAAASHLAGANVGRDRRQHVVAAEQVRPYTRQMLPCVWPGCGSPPGRGR